MEIEKRPFDIDVLEPDLGFIHGTIQLIHDSVLSGEFETNRAESLAWVLFEAEKRCLRVMGMFQQGTDMELQEFWNDAHPDEAISIADEIL